jgi:hypothetical protein
VSGLYVCMYIIEAKSLCPSSGGINGLMMMMVMNQRGDCMIMRTIKCIARELVIGDRRILISAVIRKNSKRVERISNH